MIDTTITINSSYSRSSTPLVLNYRTRDTSTDLVFHGDGAFNFGQDLLTNLVLLTENFCNSTAPLKPIKGQKYYNSSTQSLYVYDNGWNEIVITKNTDPLEIVFETGITSPHSQYVLTDFTNKLLPLTGNLEVASITLDGNAPTDDNHAVTKKYAQSVLSVPAPYIPRDGYAEMQGPLVLMNTSRTDDDNTLVNIKYVDDLGSLDTISDVASPTNFRILTYRETDRKNVDGTDDISPYFTTVWFHTTILDGSSVAAVALPMTFIDATNKQTNYQYSLSANCTSVGANVKLHINVVDGSNISIKRSGTTGELKVCGMIYGYRAR